MQRRDFITLASSAVIEWPLRARAKSSAMPAIGFLNSASKKTTEAFVEAFRKGLEMTGYVDQRNVTIKYLWADDKYDRLPELVAQLIKEKVAVIAATGGLKAAEAAENATSTIPILYIAGFNPVYERLAFGLNHPGGNATGVNIFTAEIGGKRLDLLHKLVPNAAKIAVLFNPKSVTYDIERKDLEEAARIAGLELSVVQASADDELDRAFNDIVKQKVGALMVAADPFFTSDRDRIIELAASHEIPAAYPWSQYVIDDEGVEKGGLMSYGPSLNWAYGQIGLYAGAILKGAKPNDLPIQQPMQFQTMINLKVAKSLGLTVPPEFLALADRVIE
jgi:putative ABC transport system substrate-binding protein